jgi:hypothetical protein
MPIVAYDHISHDPQIIFGKKKKTIKLCLLCKFKNIHLVFKKFNFVMQNLKYCGSFFSSLSLSLSLASGFGVCSLPRGFSKDQRAQSLNPFLEVSNLMARNRRKRDRGTEVAAAAAPIPDSLYTRKSCNHLLADDDRGIGDRMAFDKHKRTHASAAAATPSSGRTMPAVNSNWIQLQAVGVTNLVF